MMRFGVICDRLFVQHNIIVPVCVCVYACVCVCVCVSQ